MHDGNTSVKKVIVRITRNSANLKESSSSSDEAILDKKGKKIKLDPDFTPKKYEDLKDELSMKTSVIKRVTDLNMRLQEQLCSVHEKKGELETKVKNLEDQLT